MEIIVGKIFMSPHQANTCELSERKIACQRVTITSKQTNKKNGNSRTISIYEVKIKDWKGKVNGKFNFLFSATTL